MSELTQEQVVTWIKGLTVLELSEFTKKLESELGVSGAMMMPTAAAPVATGTPAPVQAEEKTEFDVILAKVPPEKKINIIKEVRAITALGLKEAKEFVENAPNKIKEGVSKEEAQKIKAQLEAVGATIEIK